MKRYIKSSNLEVFNQKDYVTKVKKEVETELNLLPEVFDVDWDMETRTLTVLVKLMTGELLGFDFEPWEFSMDGYKLDGDVKLIVDRISNYLMLRK